MRTDEQEKDIVEADNALLRTLVEGTASATGTHFFEALVRNLAEALGVHGAWVTEYLRDSKRLRALAFWMGGQHVEGYEHPLANTPCEPVIEEARTIHFPDNVIAVYPDEEDLKSAGAVSYMGVPLLDAAGNVMGHLAVLDRDPMPPSPRTSALMRIFSSRAAAELERLKWEDEVRRREEKLACLIEGAFDAIIEFDRAGTITRVNAAAIKVFGRSAESLESSSIMSLLSPEAWKQLGPIIESLPERPMGRQYAWLPMGLEAMNADQRRFPVEGSVSRFETADQAYHVLIVRNQTERLAAERQVAALAQEAHALREALGNSTESDPQIIGTSPGIQRVLDEIAQVAPADTTVLIHGETGTGKELVAAHLHRESPRKSAPFIKVNCAAIPAHLMESEFFGHEKGAFTGAVQRREGRFSLADGGTILLDEIGEMPLDLQSKLLRVLQEGEFEPLGAARTRKVNVRVVAATNRDLAAEVAAGRFREDLYYRISVFPITLPPLRQRREDIAPLARIFAARFCKRQGKPMPTLDKAAIDRLLAYDWPGNVRELQNVMERAVLTSPPGSIRLDRALPSPILDEFNDPCVNNAEHILTAADLEALERKNIERALALSGGRISGSNGAAELLGLKPSTLNSRIKALSIAR